MYAFGVWWRWSRFWNRVVQQEDEEEEDDDDDAANQIEPFDWEWWTWPKPVTGSKFFQLKFPEETSVTFYIVTCLRFPFVPPAKVINHFSVQRSKPFLCLPMNDVNVDVDVGRRKQKIARVFDRLLRNVCPTLHMASQKVSPTKIATMDNGCGTVARAVSLRQQSTRVRINPSATFI